MSAHDSDLMRLIERERAHAKREAIDEGIQSIQNHPVGGENYLKAMKLYIRVLREVQAKF